MILPAILSDDRMLKINVSLENQLFYSNSIRDRQSVGILGPCIEIHTFWLEFLNCSRKINFWGKLLSWDFKNTHSLLGNIIHIASMHWKCQMPLMYSTLPLKCGSLERVVLAHFILMENNPDTVQHFKSGRSRGLGKHPSYYSLLITWQASPLTWLQS